MNPLVAFSFRPAKYLAALCFSAVLLLSTSAEAQYVVTETTDNGLGNVAGTLSNAILQANATGGTITFNLNGGATTINLTGSMYGISAAAPITIVGGGTTINASGFQAFTVNSGNVDFQNLTIDGARAVGQAGGNGNGGGGGGAGLGAGVYVDPNAGAIGIQNVTFTNNQAIGGAGGNGDGVSANGGNGGGYNGNAGPNTAPSGATGGAGAIGAGDGTSGGYGGGGGGGSTGATTAALGNGGGNGGLSGQGGNGGLALGGALFIGNGNTTTIYGGTSVAASNTATGGAGGTGTSPANNGTAGTANAGGIYVGITSAANFDTTLSDITVAGNIFSHGDLNIIGPNVVNFLGTTIVSTASNPGANTNIASGGTLNTTTLGLMGAVTNDGTLRFTQSGLGMYNGQVSGSGQVEIEGGGTVRFDEIDTTTTLATNTYTYTGQTTVNVGTLFLGTTLASSSVNVAAGGSLLGDGTIAGDLVSGGIFAPGDNGIGTFNVGGNFTANAGSTTQIEINNGGTTPGVNNDAIVVAGNVTLNGGNVVVQTTGGSYTAGTSYTFLQYGGNRVGTFSGITTNSAFLGAELVYDDLGKAIAFMLIGNGMSYQSVAQTSNQSAVGGYLDANRNGATGDFAAFLNELDMLDAASARTALNQISGEAYGTGPQVQFQSTTMQTQVLLQHISSLGDAPLAAEESYASITDVVYRGDRDEPLEFVCRNDRLPSTSYWTTGYGLAGSAEGDGNASGLNFGQGGVLVGADHWLDDAALVGLYGGYNYARFDGVNLPQNVKAGSGQFGGYLRRNFDGGRHISLAGGFGFDNYESARTVNVGGFNANAVGNYDGWQSVAYGEYGRTFRVGRGRLTPYAGLQYIYLRQNSFMETGAAPVNLDVAGIDAHSLRNVLGLRFDRSRRMRGGRMLTPQVRAAWLHEYLATSTAGSNRFVGIGGTSFAAQGLDLGRDWALLGAGLTWQVSARWSLAANYDAQLNQNQTFHAGSGTLQYIW